MNRRRAITERLKILRISKEIKGIVFSHIWIRCNIGKSRVFYICYFLRSECRWCAEDSIFHGGESRKYLYSRTLFFSRSPHEFFAVAGLNGRRERTHLYATNLGNGNWHVACIARSTHIYLRILSCHAIRKRCINRLSISECIPNFIEIHWRSAYLVSCYLTIICVFSKERQCLLVSRVRAFT